jgi:exosortase/archaeosortase family protein
VKVLRENKWTAAGLGFLALAVCVLLLVRSSYGVTFMLLIVGFAIPAYFVAARRVKQPFLGFLARYGAIFLALQLIEMVLMAYFPGAYAEIRHVTARMVGGVLGLGGLDYQVSGSIVELQNPSFAANITSGCVGGVAFWVFVGLVVATPGASLKQRLASISVGLVLLLLYNLTRMTASIYFEWANGVAVHDYFYVFNLIFILIIWAVWLRTLKPKRPSPPPAVA